MPQEQTVAIAAIRLARSMRRQLVLPALLWILGGVAIGAAAVQLDDPLRLLGVAGGAMLVLIGAWLAIVPLTVRLQVEVGAIRVRWIGGERVHALVRGSVTRVTLKGPNAAKMRPRLGPLSRGLGTATLRGEERIELVRLAPTASAILVPTDRGRLLVAPALEQELLNALAASARVQARLDQVAERTRALVARVPAGDPAAAAAAHDRAAAEIEPRALTGIERQLLEERLAAERAAALAAAEAERAAAEAVAQRAAQEAAEREAARAAAAAEPEPARRGMRIPAWRRSPEPPAAVAADRPHTAPLPARGRRNRRNRGLVTAPPGTGALIVLTLLPTLSATAGWLLFTFTGADRHSDAERLITGLVLVGPLASLGVLMARRWWPRLAPLVAYTSVTTLALLAWSIAGRA
ncbi:MAG TPA: hypothetical protein VFM19_04475 [Candidatus Limnocylindria bacterium]|nr:hypothetical protein [Candidatus Limnocylindria bacterium]